jgi:hypothetical protein
LQCKTWFIFIPSSSELAVVPLRSVLTSSFVLETERRKRKGERELKGSNGRGSLDEEGK